VRWGWGFGFFSRFPFFYFLEVDVKKNKMIMMMTLLELETSSLSLFNLISPISSSAAILFGISLLEDYVSRRDYDSVTDRLASEVDQPMPYLPTNWQKNHETWLSLMLLPWGPFHGWHTSIPRLERHVETCTALWLWLLHPKCTHII
jgi:hypothetical protein